MQPTEPRKSVFQRPVPLAFWIAGVLSVISVPILAMEVFRERSGFDALGQVVINSSAAFLAFLFLSAMVMTFAQAHAASDRATMEAEGRDDDLAPADPVAGSKPTGRHPIPPRRIRAAAIAAGTVAGVVAVPVLVDALAHETPDGEAFRSAGLLAVGLFLVLFLLILFALSLMQSRIESGKRGGDIPV